MTKETTLTKTNITEGFKRIGLAYRNFSYTGEMTNLWHHQMNKIAATPQQFLEAIDEHILESSFEPKIADIVRIIRRHQGPF